jgi:Tfp pilus assembly protein PilV
MLRNALPRLRDEQDGVILIEIVVSAMLLVIVALGVFTAFDAGTRATAQERHRARANSLAEQDVERMRGMRIADLSGLNQTRTVTLDGLNYTVRSLSTFVNEPATTSTCAAGTGSRDLIQVTSTVTWSSIGTRPPVTVSSLVSPPNGSVVPNSGSLLASVKDSRSAGMSGVTLTGSGAGSFTGTTAAGGCVLWRNLPQGTYTLTFGGTAAGKVDPDGLAPTGQTVSVVAGATNTVSYLFDTPGRIQNIAFRTRDYSNNLDATTWDSVVVDQTGMTSARAFTGARTLLFSTPTSLFPFTSPYALYAGTCGSNNPGSGNGLGSATVPVGGSVTGPTLQLPSLLVTLWSGTSSSSPGTRVSGGDVTVFDDDCNVQRTLTTSTNSNGQVPEDTSGTPSRPMTALPYGTNYDICANNSGATDRRVVSDFDLVSSGSTGTVLDIYLGGTTGGSCP